MDYQKQQAQMMQDTNRLQDIANRRQEVANELQEKMINEIEKTIE